MYLLHVTSYSQRVLHVKVINLQFHSLWFAKIKNKKNPPSYVWYLNLGHSIILGRGPKLLVRMGRKFPTMGRLPRANLAIILYLVYVFLEKDQAILSWIPLSFFGCSSLFSYVSLSPPSSPTPPPQQKKAPYFLVSFPFYSAPLVGSQWWCFIPFVMWNPPLFKIPDSVEPCENSLKTCT